MAREGGRRHDYIPRPLAQFNEWYTNLINYIKQVTFARDNPWTHIPAQENNAFVAAFNDWTAAYTPKPSSSPTPNAAKPSQSRCVGRMSVGYAGRRALRRLKPPRII